MAKIFRGRDVTLLYSQLRCLFRRVCVAKPRSSRNSSMESFVVCRGFRPPPTEGGARAALVQAATDSGAAAGTLALAGWLAPPGAKDGAAAGTADPSAGGSLARGPLVPSSLAALEHAPGTNERASLARCAVPFVACGDLRGFDSDKSYPLQVVPSEAELRSLGFSAEAAREQVRKREEGASGAKGTSGASGASGGASGRAGDSVVGTAAGGAGDAPLPPVQPPISPAYRMAIEEVRRKAHEPQRKSKAAGIAAGGSKE